MHPSVFLVDEHAIFRDAVAELIQKRTRFEIVGEAADGPTALTQIPELKPDIVLLDAALPRLSGIEVTRRLARCGSVPRVLVLSAQGGGPALKQALAAGAAGCLSKADPSEELIEGIEAVAAGRRYVSPSLAHHLIEIVASDDACDEGGAGNLTSREREILQLVAEGLSSKEIASSLNISTRTVESHRARVMEKLGIHKVSGLVRYAIREGLLSP
ncbi:MAG: response regulator [Myxococcota bacterium]